MLCFFLLALVPIFAHAGGLAEWQQPLPQHPGDSKCGRGRQGVHYGGAFSFRMNGDWRYYFTDYFPSDWHCYRGELTPLGLDVLDDIGNRAVPPKPQIRTKLKSKLKQKNKPVSLMLTIPFNTEAEGPLVIEPNPDWKLFHHMDTSIEFLWTKTERPGRDLNVTSVGVRQGVTTSSRTYSAYLDFGSPYLGLPGDVFDFLFLTTQPPQRVEMGRGMRAVDLVDCNTVSTFPDIVYEFEEGAQELTIKPEQYVLRVNDQLGGQFVGKCVLLAARSGELSIGWAALRGRTVWLDWANKRTGFVV